MIMNTVKPILIALVTLVAIVTLFALNNNPLRAAGMSSAAAPKVADVPKATAKPESSTGAKTSNRPKAAPLAVTSPKPVVTKPSDKKPAATADKSSDKLADKSPDKTPAKRDLELTPTQEDKLLALLNTGNTGDLTAISGIAATRAEAIVGARPFQNLHEVILVPGVGDATFDRILKHGKTLTQTSAKSAKS